jgi:type IV secretory pathway VirB4 component
VLGSQQFDGFLAQTIESLIPLGTKAFYEDPDIQRRFTEARVDGLGSIAWTNTPTLVDMEKFFVPERIDLGYQDDNIDKALKYIRLRLQYWKASSIGDAICKPSTFDTDSKLITFALTNLQSNKESEVFAMSAYIAASRQSLSCPNSVFFMDEASVLLRFPAFSRLVGRKCATARKSGCRVIIAAQDVISIAKSEAGEQILQNMPLRLIGKIVSGAANSFHEHLGIPTEIIENNETFAPDAQQLYTLWLFDYNKIYIKCRYYPSYPLLALVVNSREEQAARDRFKAQYRDKFDWLLHFSKHYVSCIKQGKPL